MDLACRSQFAAINLFLHRHFFGDSGALCDCCRELIGLSFYSAVFLFELWE